MTAVKKPKNISKTVEEDGFNFFDHSVLPQSIIEKIRNFVFKCDRCPCDFERFFWERLSLYNNPTPSSVCQRCWKSRRCQECKGILPPKYEYYLCDGCGRKLIDKVSRRHKIEKISN